MKLSDLDMARQNAIGNELFKYCFPLYCETECDGFDYHFIGSSFLLEFDKRIFSIFTKHQYDIALGKTIFITHSKTDRGLNISKFKGFVSEDSDLVIFEINNPSNELDEKRNLVIPINFLKQPKSFNDCEMVALGYPRVINNVGYNDRTIKPIPGGIVSSEFDLKDGRNTIVISTNNIKLGVIKDINTHYDLTQGYSGGPVFGLKIIDKDDCDFVFVGVSSFSSENPPAIHVVRTLEILDCLHHSYGIFDKCIENDIDE